MTTLNRLSHAPILTANSPFSQYKKASNMLNAWVYTSKAQNGAQCHVGKGQL